MTIFDSISKDSYDTLWEMTDLPMLEDNLLEMQCNITKAVYNKNNAALIALQEKLVCSSAAKKLAVRHVCASVSMPGIDGVRWNTPTERMKADVSLTSKDYKSSPMKMIIVKPKGSTKKRNIQIPTVYDRAMQTLYAYALDPVSEASGCKKSFAFRKGRSLNDAHAFIMKALSGQDAPRYVVKADVKACYASISHEWLIENIPMDKSVLVQFLKSGHIFAGELFPPDDYGISLGSSISPILGNMALDDPSRAGSMQAEIFNALHCSASGDIDYAEGNLIRFADDCFFTARSVETAERIIESLTEFLRPRGMKLSEEKTKIVDLNGGIDFLSRNYRTVKGIVCSAPSEQAVAKFENNLRDLILNYHGSQGALIEKLNQKLNGWATYHKITDAADTFRHIDVVVKTYLLQLCQKLHPTLPRQSVINKYFFKDYDGELVYALSAKSDVRVVRLANVILIDYKLVALSKNPYLDGEYHKFRTKEREIQNVTGKYKAIWTRQRGKCYYCGQSILADQRKDIVTMDLSYLEKVNNLAYIHEKCKYCEIQFVEAEQTLDSVNDLQTVLEKLAAEPEKRRKVNLKFKILTEYFRTLTASRVTLSFDDISKIVGVPLCSTAQKQKNYWYRRGYERISECWRTNGYKISDLSLEKKRVIFTKTADSVALILPAYLQGHILPHRLGAQNCKAEIDNFFEYMKSKYGL